MEKEDVIMLIKINKLTIHKIKIKIIYITIKIKNKEI